MSTNNSSPICTTCGTQYPSDMQLPVLCTICDDDRQYVGENGQTWTSVDELKKNHSVSIKSINDNLYGLKVEPDFAIANRAILLTYPGGNILWDCIPLLDDETIRFVRSVGGLKAIAFSHPHYYSNMNDWAAEFECPIYIHEADSEWITYPTEAVRLWKGDELELWDGIRIIHAGGHFPGSCMLHVPWLSPKGTVLCGDSVNISPSKRHTAVMYSYPNHILLSKTAFDAFDQKTGSLVFDCMYGAFDHQNLPGIAMEVFKNSMQRYRDSYSS
ncbi:MBL fold metallo-hydrolase [Mucilaginibacter agri]|uniref:MBL fold metallo-hydrolase n=1 Tax=Mucilaginibacter agri TaxID=2695265 RepID=A0A966DTA0_9SPHI|nr:MBL fold metallo-hydrolase [Mucilaginibacter agri]NCD71033.1 MBL fold metallo-hydrolase [Mucilaginibacter agri]